MTGEFPYKCIGQHENTADAMFAVLHALVGNPNARQKTRKMFSSLYNELTNEWVDTNLMHDMIKAYEAEKADRARRPECVK